MKLQTLLLMLKPFSMSFCKVFLCKGVRCIGLGFTESRFLQCPSFRISHRRQDS
jgi:hypothetical protein